MKSIFVHIHDCLQRHEKPDLDDYVSHDGGVEFAMGAEDGMIYYHFGISDDEKTVSFLEKILLTNTEETSAANAQLINDYFAADETLMIECAPLLERHLIDNREKMMLVANYLLAKKLVIDSCNIEAVKLGIMLLGCFNVREVNPELYRSMLELAQCDEFGFWVEKALLESYSNTNGIRFEVAKKAHGWAKIFLVEGLIPENEEIRDWMFHHGTDNDIGVFYNALSVAEKVGLRQIIARDELSEEDISSIIRLMEGLLDESAESGISELEGSNEIIDNFLKLKDRYQLKANYYYIVLYIMFYYQNKIVDDHDRNAEMYRYARNILKDDRLYRPYLEELLSDDPSENIASIIELMEYLEDRHEEELWEQFGSRLYDYLPFLPYFLSSEKTHDLAIDWINREDEKLIIVHHEPECIITRPTKLEYIVEQLENLPLVGKHFVIQALNSRYNECRRWAVMVIETWTALTQKSLKDLDDEIYRAALQLQKTELVKARRKKLNMMLGISEDLSNYIEPNLIYERGDDHEEELYFRSVD